MEKQNYYQEYQDELDTLLEKFCLKAKQNRPDAFSAGNYSLEKSVQNQLWLTLQHSNYRLKYNQSRCLGLPTTTAGEPINDLLNSLLPALKMVSELPELQPLPDNLYASYHSFNNRLVFYCKNLRLYHYLLPVIEAISEPIIVLSETGLPGPVSLGDSVTFMSLSDFHLFPHVHNSYIEKTFKKIFQYANALCIFTELLHPKAFFLIEGPHFETAFIGEIGRHSRIPTVCLQQGWPGVLHTAFRNMNYDYYLTWGKEFNALWKKYNPHPRFIDTGYAYSILTLRPKEYITFFLQAPVILMDQESYSDMLYLIECVADTFPDQKIYIREHPEYYLPSYYHPYFARFPNIYWGTELPLNEIYAVTKIGVAAYSSTLAEGMIHDIIPFSYIPGASYRYSPDLEELGTGICTGTLQEALNKMTALLTEPEKSAFYLQNIRKMKTHFFTAHGNETICNIIAFLKNMKIIT